MDKILMKPALVFFLEGVSTVLPVACCYIYAILTVLCTCLTLTVLTVSTMNNVYHRNLKRLYQMGVLTWFLLVSSKILVLVTQHFYFYKGAPNATGLSILNVSAFLRYLYVFFFTATPLSIIIERSLATLFLADYERRRRRWIFWAIFVSNLTTSVLFSWLICQQLISIVAFTLHILTVLALSVALYTALFMYNNRRLAFLETHPTTYTLSIKYQLRENLVTLRSMRSLLLVILCAIFVILMAYVIPVLLRMEVWQVHLFIDIAYHFNPLYTSPACLFFIPQNRQLIASRLGLTKTAKRVVYANEGDVYFNMFQKSLTTTTTTKF